jgi:hypothetical protein
MQAADNKIASGAPGQPERRTDYARDCGALRGHGAIADPA